MFAGSIGDFNAQRDARHNSGCDLRGLMKAIVRLVSTRSSRKFPRRACISSSAQLAAELVVISFACSFHQLDVFV